MKKSHAFELVCNVIWTNWSILVILLQSANLFISVSSGFRSLFSGNLYCLFLVFWSGFCFRILSTKAIKVIIFPSLDQSFHLDITNCLFAINNRRWRIWGLVMKSEEAHKASFFLNGDWVKADNSPFCSWTFVNMNTKSA